MDFRLTLVSLQIVGAWFVVCTVCKS